MQGVFYEVVEMTVGITHKTRAAGTQIRPGGKRISAGNRRGQSMIEFAMVVPLLLAMLTGMVSFAFIMHNYLVLTNGVNLGAQLIATSRGQTTDPCAAASAAVENAAPSLAAANLSFTFRINGNSYTLTSCTGGAAQMAQGATAQVTASYPCSFAIFLMSFPSCSIQTTTAEVIQ